MPLPTPQPPAISTRTWIRIWLLAAALGTALLVVVFGAYELAERWWLLEHLPLQTLFFAHIIRGAGASVLVGTATIGSVLLARRSYDRAFARAYAELETAMKTRSRELEQSHAFTERLFDALRDKIVVLDRSGVVVKANRVAIEGAAPRTLVGRPCTMAGSGCTPSSDGCVAMQAIRLRRPVIGECVQSDPRSGRIFSIDAFPVPDLDGTGPIVIESAHDITEQRQLEAHVRYQEKLAALGVLSAGIAHDIANPLASMSSELEMLEEETDPARVRASFAVLRSQVSRIDRSLREMTDFARRRGDETTSVSVEQAVNDALRMVRHDPRARKVSFEVDIAAGLPKLRMVEDHLVMVLVNLVINAFDAMPDGGQLAIRARRDAGGLSIIVSDTGTGMTDEVKKRAAEPLFTTKGGGRGTGLGLSVSAEILASAKGTLGIESSPLHGTTVRLHFGAAAVESPPEREEVAHA